MAVDVKKSAEELNIDRISHKIASGIMFCVVTVLAVMYGVWLYGWYNSDSYVWSGIVIHIAVWLLALSFPSSLVTCVMGILGFKKKWTHWTKWE